MSIQWSQDSISLSQLQNLFNQYPGLSQLHIQFPNQTGWDISPSGLQSIYTNYVQQAKSLGVSNIPNLSFSSLNLSGLSSGLATIPIKGTIGSMQQETQGILQQIQTQPSGLLNYIPEWLRKIVMMIYNGFVILYSFASEQVKKFLH